MWSGNFQAAFSTLRMTKWRTILTMLGIVIGISSVVTVVGLGEGLKHQIVGQINQLGSDVITVRPGKIVNTNPDGSTSADINYLAFFSASTLSDQDLEALQKVPSATAAVPIDFTTSTAKSDSKELNNILVAGTKPELADMLHQKVAFGSFFDRDDPNDHFAVIGNNVARQLYNEFNPVGQTITIQGEDFIIHGVLAQSSGGLLSVAESDFNSAVFIPYSTAKPLNNGRDNILQILVKARDGKNLDATVSDVKKTLMKTHAGQENFTVLKQYELLNIASGVLNTLTGFISGIAAISLLVGGIGIMDIMLVSVSERTREIGIRKALGATNRQILSQFLVEGLVLSIGGGIIGIIASFAINFLLKVYTNLHPVVTLPVLALAVGVSVLVGIIFSVAPALKAAQKDPIVALRNE